MKQMKFQLLTLFLCASMLLCAVACTPTAPTDPTPGKGNSSEGNQLGIVVDGEAKYRVVRGDMESVEVRNAMLALIDAIENATGVRLIPVNDYEPYDEKVVEIIVGKDNNRPAAQGVVDSLEYEGFRIVAVDGNIVIAGNTDEATYAAVACFIKTYIAQPGETLTVPEETDVTMSILQWQLETRFQTETLKSSYSDYISDYKEKDLVAFDESEDIAIVCFQCHPDVIGGKGISADWPGFVRRYTEEALHDVKCILVNGFQGDSNHINPLRDAEEDKKRTGYKHASYMGKTISDTAVSLWDKAAPVEVDRVWATVKMEYVPTNMRGIERAEECRKIRAEIAAGTREPFKDHTANIECARIADLQRELIFQNIPVCALCVGKVAFIGLGGEPFTQYAANAREVGKDLYVITACLTGGGQGYLPTGLAYEQGGFEAQTSRFDACVEEQLKNAMKSLFDEYKSN